MARRRKSKPTGKKRSETQRVKDRLAHAQDDAQRLGIIPTLPEEVLGSARVDPATQGAQPQPGLVGRAVRNGWATPEHIKVAAVDEMGALVTDPETEPHVKVAAARVLQQADKDQWERDNPELAGKTKGGVQVTNTNIANANNQVSVLDMAVAAYERDAEAEAQRDSEGKIGERPATAE